MTATVTFAHFVIKGEFITERARDLWESGDGKKALGLLALVHDLPKSDAIAICEGSLKLVGDSDSGCQTEPDDYDGITLDDLLSPKEPEETVPESLLPESREYAYEDEAEEEEDQPPASFDTITSSTGWLTPEGKFYPCGHGEHNQTAYDAKLNQSDPAMCRMCLFSFKGDTEPDQKFFLNDYTACTQVQRGMIAKYCEAQNIPIPFYLRDSNDRPEEA